MVLEGGHALPLDTVVDDDTDADNDSGAARPGTRASYENAIMFPLPATPTGATATGTEHSAWVLGPGGGGRSGGMTAASAAVSEDVVASYEMFSILNDGTEHMRAAPATPAVARGTVGRVGQPGCAVRLTAPSDVEHGEDDCSALTTAQQESTSDLPDYASILTTAEQGSTGDPQDYTSVLTTAAHTVYVATPAATPAGYDTVSAGQIARAEATVVAQGVLLEDAYALALDTGIDDDGDAAGSVAGGAGRVSFAVLDDADEPERSVVVPRGGRLVLDPRPVHQAATGQHGSPRTSVSEQHIGDEFVAEGATVFAIPRD